MSDIDGSLTANEKIQIMGLAVQAFPQQQQDLVKDTAVLPSVFEMYEKMVAAITR